MNFQPFGKINSRHYELKSHKCFKFWFGKLSFNLPLSSFSLVFRDFSSLFSLVSYLIDFTPATSSFLMFIYFFPASPPPHNHSRFLRTLLFIFSLISCRSFSCYRLFDIPSPAGVTCVWGLVTTWTSLLCQWIWPPQLVDTGSFFEAYIGRYGRAQRMIRTEREVSAWVNVGQCFCSHFWHSRN